MRTPLGNFRVSTCHTFVFPRSHVPAVVQLKTMLTEANPGRETMRVLSVFLVVILMLSSLAVAQSTDWQQLFNGKDLTGWKHVGPGGDTVEDGLIRTHGGMGLLYWTGGKVGNCVIRVVFKMRDTNDNSGVFIRIPIEPREEWMPVHYGYEVQIDNHPETSNEDEYHITGTLYSLTKPLAKPGKPGPEWNTMEITLDGPHTVVVVNGMKVTDYTEGDPVPERKFDFEPQHGPRPLEGYFGLQNHSDNDVVFFKEVAIKKLH
jgi:3-keto-disaccharide hydrolase